MSGKITITNQAPSTAIIDIEGTIGVPEAWQFEEPGQRVSTYETLSTTLENIRNLKAGDITVNIRSTGGNVNDALLIYDALCSTGAKITTRCFGYVASAATIIAQAASPGGREISANSLYLIHKSVCAAEGNSQQMSQTIDMLNQTDSRIAEIYATRSGKPVSQFTELMSVNNGNGRWLSPQQVLESSLADKITESKPINKDADNLIRNLGLPPIPKQNRLQTMNISKRWNAILELLGINPAEAAADISLPHTNQGHDDEVDAPENDAQAEAYSVEAYAKQVDELRNKIISLEAQNARLAALPTSTKPKEDPAPHEVKRSANDAAYMEDLKNFLTI